MSSRDPRVWMWTEACEVIERAERIHRQFFRIGTAAARPTWEPPADIYETREALIIQVALPGVAPERMFVGFEDGSLVVAGERSLPAELRSAEVFRLEIPHGRFERRIELPPGRYGIAGHELVNGCVVVRLDKLP